MNIFSCTKVLDCLRLAINNIRLRKVQLQLYQKGFGMVFKIMEVKILKCALGIHPLDLKVFAERGEHLLGSLLFKRQWMKGELLQKNGG